MSVGKHKERSIDSAALSDTTPDELDVRPSHVLPASTADTLTAPEEEGDCDDGLLGVAVPIMIACYVIAILCAVFTFWGSGEALFAIAISVFYGAMYFGVPMIMTRTRMSHDLRWRSDQSARSSDIVYVSTGPISRFSALVQMVIVPLAVAVLFASFSIVLLVVKP